jgi:hypothetical protein
MTTTVPTCCGPDRKGVFGGVPLSRREEYPVLVDIQRTHDKEKKEAELAKPLTPAPAPPAAVAAPAAAAVGACACDASVGCGYMVKCEKPLLVSASTSTTVVIVPPENCVPADVARVIDFSCHTTLEEMRTSPGAMRDELAQEIKIKLAPGGDATVAPRFLIPYDVQLLSTCNNSLFKFVATADFVPVAAMLTSKGLVGTFEIPRGDHQYSAKAGRLFHIGKEHLQELLANACLFGISPGDLMAQMEKPSETTRRIVSGSALARIMKVLMPAMDISMPVAEAKMQEAINQLVAYIETIKKFVITPDKMSMSLEPVGIKRATPILDMLKYALGQPTDRQVEYYNRTPFDVGAKFEVHFMAVM